MLSLALYAVADAIDHVFLQTAATNHAMFLMIQVAEHAVPLFTFQIVNKLFAAARP